MILFEVDAQGYVRSTPSLIPQGMALSDIVIITESDYELVTLRLIPPSGRYIPDVVCTPVKTQNKSATLWQAILPAEAAAMHGVLTYQIFRRNVQGRVIPTQEGALTVQRGVISDMPENVEHLETYSIDSLYNLLTAIQAKTEDHDRGIDKNASDIAANAAAITANSEDIADNAERIETNADNHLQLLDRLYGEDGDVPDIRATLTEHGGQIENLMGDAASNKQKIDNEVDRLDGEVERLDERIDNLPQSSGGISVGRGEFTIPLGDWEDDYPDRAVAVFPAETFGNGDVVIVSPADDATREAAKAAGLFIRMAMSGDYEPHDDQIMLARATTGLKPTEDMRFVYAVLHTDSDANALVTLIGVDAAGGSEPTLVDLSRFEGVAQEDGSIKGYITEVFGEGEDAPTKVTEVVYDEDGNIIKIGNTAINWGEEG